MSAKHGDINLSITGKILTVEGHGPWNLESMHFSTIDSGFLKQKAILTEGRWGVLVLAKGDAMFVPDARQLLLETIKSDLNEGRVATALIVTECVTPHFVIEHLTAIYQEAGDVIEVFNDETDAKLWLMEKINNAEQM